MLVYFGVLTFSVPANLVGIELLNNSVLLAIVLLFCEEAFNTQ